MGSNNSTLAEVFRCDICNNVNITHSTEDHRCKICGIKGEHGAFQHNGCKYCLENHSTIMHKCDKCNEFGHTTSCHECYYCDGPHKSYSHPCTVCLECGHEKTVDEHSCCQLCDVPKCYTHDVVNHVKSVYKGFSPEEYKKFKYCSDCDNVVETADGSCLVCGQLAPEYIKCPRNECGFTMDNQLLFFCMMCGTEIKCDKCLGDVEEDAFSYYQEHYDCDYNPVL